MSLDAGVKRAGNRGRDGAPAGGACRIGGAAMLKGVPPPRNREGRDRTAAGADGPGGECRP